MDTSNSGPCTNEQYRQLAHRRLDELFKNTDTVKGWFGIIGLEIQVQNGQCANLQEIFRRNHKLN